MNKWLHRNGFSYKQPKGTLHKADGEEQQVIIEKHEVLKASIRPNEHIFHGPSQATKITHGWIRTGQEKRIKKPQAAQGLIYLEQLSLIIYIKQSHKIMTPSIQSQWLFFLKKFALNIKVAA
jgi:hypothetical protein